MGMFNSRNFLWKKGVLRSVWTAAHCLSKLKEKQVMETDIVACVDAILNGEADEPTCRILAHLLLGVVRIYSKKVEILNADFADLLHEANEYRAGKRANKRIKSLGSLIIPETFELDAFNLDISEDQGVSRVDARSREDITLADDSRREIYHENDKYYGQEDISSREAFSSANTPVRDVCSPRFMDFDLPPFDISILNSRMEKLVGTHFSSGKCLEPKMLIDIEKEPSFEINIQELARLEESVHSESVEPMILGNAEEEPDIDMASNEGYQTDEDLVHTDIEINCQEPATTVKSLGNKQSVEKLRQFGVSSVHHLQPVILCQVEKESNSAMPSKGHQLPGEQIRHTDTRIYFEESEEKSLPELTTPSHKIRGKNFSSISVNVSKGTVGSGSGSGSPELLGLHTPASMERARVLKKRKCLIDKEVIISNKVLEEQIKDSSNLVRKRNRVPSTALEIWRCQQISNLPQSLFEPLIPCKAVELMSLVSNKKSTTKLPVETSKISVDPVIVESPVAQMSATPAETPLCPVLAKSPAREMSVNLARTTPDPSLLESPITQISSGTAETPITPVLVECPVSQTSHEQTPIALTPFTHSTSLGLHEVQVSTLDEDKESDIELMDEEVNLSGSGNDEKCSWSAQTWRVATDLHRNISNMEQHKGADGFLNFSQGLKSETRTECARRFYEILALKTGDFIDVKQEDAYGDILVQEKPKLKQTINASGDEYLA